MMSQKFSVYIKNVNHGSISKQVRLQPLSLLHIRISYVYGLLKLESHKKVVAIGIFLYRSVDDIMDYSELLS